jgi:CRISPR/Cas system-associated exonuclease Cas4 (RecB family)
MCHNVLDEAVRTRDFRREDWRRHVEQLWDREVVAEKERGPREGVIDAPTRWPGYQLKRARLFQVAARVHELLEVLPPEAEVLTEEPLTAADGRLYGRPDLLIRRTERHEIIDYKSGGVVDRETNRPREAYVRQLQLYAYLEHEVSGSWAAKARLFPLQGTPVEIDVDPQRCVELATQALEAMDAYNAEVPRTPPASPTPDHCRWCPHAGVCEQFWQTCDASWAPMIIAAGGVVTRVFTTPLGGTTVYVNCQMGSVSESTIVIKNIDPFLYPDARELNAGDEVAAAGLVADEHGSGFWLRSAGIFSATRSSDMA